MVETASTTTASNSVTVATIPLYIPQPDYSVQVLAWPQTAPIPTNTTLNAIPAELAGKPVAYDFDQRVWVDKSNGPLTALQKQVAALTAMQL